MAIYHLSVKVISRGKGRNAVASAAYRRASKFFDEQCNRTWNYENKPGVIHSEITVPGNAPAWASKTSSEYFWNLVEKSEVRMNSRLAREVEFALPVELTQEQSILLAREFIKDQFASRGMLADWSVHWDNPANPHVHVMLPTRELSKSGLGNKVREWNDKSLLFTWRAKWAEYANFHLKLHQHQVRIDHRSYKDQGIDLIPTVHRGQSYRRIDEINEIKKVNLKRILEKPELLAKKIFQTIENHESVFGERDLAKAVLTYVSDKTEFDSAMQSLKKSKDLIYLGPGDEGRERYTTKRMFDLENNIQKIADRMQKQSHIRISHRKIHKSLEKYQAKIGKRLTGEQRIAVEHIVSKDSIVCIVGRAGTGKSFSLGAANAVWKAKGLKVYGIALMGVAAAGLGKNAGIDNRTIESFRFSVEQGIIKLSRRDVIVMDEAGMTDSVAMEAVLKAVHQSRAKLVLVGDHAQLQPVGPGATFRAILERVGFEELQTVYRQEIEWQREATKEFSRGDIKEGIERYQRNGFIHFEKNEDAAMQKLVDRWDVKDSLVLAHRNKDVDELNLRLRQKRIDQNEISQGYAVNSRNEVINISQGDKILFLKNKKILGVKNGNFAEITNVKFSESGKVLNFTVVLDDDKSREITIDPNAYSYFTYGYAATVHKSQGVTVDNTHVYLGGRRWNRNLTYVAMSRHRYSCNVYGDQNTHKTLESLKYNVSRKAHKDSILDYPLAFSERRGIDIESLMRRLPEYLAQKFSEKLNKLRTKVAEIVGVSETLPELLKNYVDCQIKQTRLVHLIGATKFNSPNESRDYLNQYKENKVKINNLVKKISERPDAQENFCAMKKIKPVKLSERGGFVAIADRVSKTQFEPHDMQVLFNEIHRKLLAQHHMRKQEESLGGGRKY